jgi:hypothetical protein
MVLARLQKKIGEADFFLRKMHEQEPRIIGDKEPFDYYLSAFLNAAMSVRDGFQIRQDRPRNTAVKAWREQWERSLSADEKSLYDFMHKDRVDEVHYHGSSRDVGQEGVPFPIGTHHVDGGMVTISGPPGMDPAVAYRPDLQLHHRRRRQQGDGSLRRLSRLAAAHGGRLRGRQSVALRRSGAGLIPT